MNEPKTVQMPGVSFRASTITISAEENKT